MKVYCINLPRSKDRRENMIFQLRKLPCDSVFIEAVDGKALSANEINECYSCWRTLLRNGVCLTPAEVGCALSHLKFMREVDNSTEGFGVLIEDDVTFLDGINVALNEVEHFLKKAVKPTLVQLPGVDRDVKTSNVGDNDNQFIKVHTATGAYAYAVNRAAAQLFLKTFNPICMPIDRYGYMIKRLGLDMYVYAKKTLKVDMENESTIGANRFVILNNIIAKLLFKCWRCLGLTIDWCLS